MKKFKAGDRVIVNNPYCGDMFGKKGTIVDFSDDWGYKVKLDGEDDYFDTYFNAPYLSLVKKNKSTENRVIINPPAVILFKDGKKYVAKAQDEPFDAERGLMVALLKSFGIGYSDLQKMLRDAKYQKNISICKTEYSADELYKKAGITQETEIKYPKVVLDAIDELKQKPKKKRGRPRKTDNIDNYAKMLKEKGILSRTAKDEPAKPKAKRGRPRKVKQDEVYTWESEEPKREMSIDDCNKMPKIVRVKRPVGRPRKFREGDIVAIKRLRTYKYAKIANRAKSRILSATYKVENVGEFDNSVFIENLGWFLPSEVELIEKSK